MQEAVNGSPCADNGIDTEEVVAALDTEIRRLHDPTAAKEALEHYETWTLRGNIMTVVDEETMADEEVDRQHMLNC